MQELQLVVCQVALGRLWPTIPMETTPIHPDKVTNESSDKRPKSQRLGWAVLCFFFSVHLVLTFFRSSQNGFSVENVLDIALQVLIVGLSAFFIWRRPADRGKRT
jgi:hypothetical protein